MMTSAQQAYQSATVEGVTQLRAQILVLDQICLQLNYAAAAAAKQDIAGRCRATNEAFHLLGHLESWVALFEETALAASLKDLYRHCRAQLLVAQRTPQPQPFLDVADLLAGISAAWRTKENTLHASDASSFPESPLLPNAFPGSQGLERRWQG